MMRKMWRSLYIGSITLMRPGLEWRKLSCLDGFTDTHRFYHYLREQASTSTRLQVKDQS